MTRSYRLPLVGNVWLHADRLWVLYAQQSGEQNWIALLPGDVKKRMGDSAATPAVDLERAVKHERDGLAAALWMMLPAAVPMLGLMFLLGQSIFLPLFQVIGNLG